MKLKIHDLAMLDKLDNDFWRRGFRGGAPGARPPLFALIYKAKI